MIVVPAGEFLMGSPDGEGDGDEHPQHKVTIAKPIAVGIAPVTRGEFATFVRRLIMKSRAAPMFGTAGNGKMTRASRGAIRASGKGTTMGISTKPRKAEGSAVARIIVLCGCRRRRRPSS